jgi:histidine triad (HIT) family protein
MSKNQTGRALLRARLHFPLPYFGAETPAERATSRAASNNAPYLITETSMANTIFGRIIAGQIPCYKVYEDDKVLAFLDIGPLTRGHTLVIPKEPAETLDRLSDDSAAALGRALPRICRAVIAATGVTEYNVLENNGAGAHQAVSHVHFHIIPKPNKTEGLGLDWPAYALDAVEAEQLAAKIRTATAEIEL